MSLSLDDVELQAQAASYSDYIVKIEPGTLKIKQSPNATDECWANGSVIVCFGSKVIRRCSFSLPIYEGTDIESEFRGILASLSTHVLKDLKTNGNPGFIAIGSKSYSLYDGADQVETKKITRAIEW